MPGQPVPRDLLIHRAGRHALAVEGPLIAAAARAAVHVLDAQLLQARHRRLQDRPQCLAVAGPGQAGDLARAAVVVQVRRGVRHLVLVLLDIGQGAVTALFFAGEQDEANGALRRGAFRQDAGRFQDHAGAGAVVQGALAQVPGIQVGAEDHELVRLLGAADFAHGVEDLDRPGNELVADLQLDARRRRRRPARQAAEHGVMLVGHVADGDLVVSAGPLVADPGGSGRQKAEVPFRIVQDSRRPFALEQLLLGGNHPPVDCVHPVLVRLQGRGKTADGLVDFRQRTQPGGRTEEDHLALELSPVSLQVLLLFRRQQHDFGLQLAVGARHPSPRRQRQRVAVVRLQEACADRAALPALGEQVRLVVHVDEAVRLHLVGGPVVGFLQRRRPRQPRADHVAQVGEIGHQLGALLGVGDDLLVERLGGRGRIIALAGMSDDAEERGQQQAERPV